MSSCCSSPPPANATNKFFSKESRQYVKKFLKKGLAKERRYLLEGITKVSPEGKTILDIGCGVGGLHLELLKRGASSAQGIDISEGMLEGAKNLSQQFHFTERTTYTQGDFVEVSGTTKEADITILDKVVCCYANPDELLRQSIAKTKSIYALSFPRNKALIHAGIWTITLIRTLLRQEFHPYWHEWGKMIKQIEAEGFRHVFRNETVIWDVNVFVRD